MKTILLFLLVVTATCVVACYSVNPQDRAAVVEMIPSADSALCDLKSPEADAVPRVRAARAKIGSIALGLRGIELRNAGDAGVPQEAPCPTK